MRLGIDVRALQFDGGLRGTGRYVHNLIQGLVSLDKASQIALISLKELPFPDRLKEFLPNVSVCEVAGPATLQTSYPWYQSRVRLRKIQILTDICRQSYYKRSAVELAAAIKRAKLDLVHFAAPFDPNLAPASGCPTPTVYTFLDAIPIIFRDKIYDAWPKSAQTLYDRQKVVFQSATSVVGISDCSRDDAVRLYNIPAKCAHRVYAALERELHTPVNYALVEAAKLKFGLTQRYFVFCSVADLHKGVDALLDSVSLARQKSGYPYQLAILGPQPPKMLTLLKDLCAAAGLTEADVVVTGFITEAELRALFKGAIALVSPSRYEGFGYPAAQALAIGTPVIASNRSSLPEVVGEAGILIDPDKVAEIAKAMLRIDSDKAVTEDLIARGLDRAKMFDVELLAAQMWEIYEMAARQA